jgi:hypothetical protein
MKLRSVGLIFTSVAVAIAIFLVTLFYVRRDPQPEDIPSDHAQHPQKADLRIVTYPSNSKMHVIKGDITTLKTTHGLEVDAIVNAANEQLNAGGGVCGAIFRAANDKRLQ